MNEVKIVINGMEYRATGGEMILTVAARNGIRIPSLCSDKRLEPCSSCFLCVVEVEGMKGLQPSCSTPVNNGMVISTDNIRIRKARKTALELLLSNHYADCIAPCRQTCPAGVDVQGYISLIEKGQYREAIALIKESNPLPAICGRVCVRPCEAACRRNLLDEGAAIDYMKRYAADRDLEDINRFLPATEPPTARKVAIIGAGPGGLSAAYWLQQKGHQCDIYEAAPFPGGWLRYGIPGYRLPNSVLDREIEAITGIGVRIFCNQKLGDNLLFADIASEYDAFVLTAGSQKALRLGCEGDDAENLFAGIDFLRQMELTGKRYDMTGKTVAVVGGGNTAMDCSRTSLRCGAARVLVIYRRTENEMPANPIEIHESKQEGVEYMFLTAPVRVNKDPDGKLKSLTLIKMVQGEPDSSGRKRPVPVPGSEFEMAFDCVLAATGQKTELTFIDDINSSTVKGIVKTDKHGNIEADRETLQTGAENIFAAGDCVTGPATIIEAIAQARIATHSCHQYLMGAEVTPPEKTFYSRKENFRKPSDADYNSRFVTVSRHEMPVLNPKERMNFDEVELGYSNENVVRQEAGRCLECGCSAFFDCDLQRYATEYQAGQQRFNGGFNSYDVDFSHPFIEIDRNKCILCGKCVRICREYVGADALGFVNRGFATFVSPCLDSSLLDTDCESCGMCISVCPTGAIMENYKFKPGPVETFPLRVIDFFGSEGCAYDLYERAGFFYGADGTAGFVNKDGSIGRQQRFGYNVLNRLERITKPLVKVDGSFREAEFDEALDIIAERIRSVEPDQNLFFAGARLTNEEMYLIQKIARAAVKTNNVASFHYMGRCHGFLNSSDDNVSFSELGDAAAFFIVGAELSRDNQYAGFLVNSTRYKKKTPVRLFTTEPDSAMKHKSDEVNLIGSYYHFILAVNHFIVSNRLYNLMYIADHCSDFDSYAAGVTAVDYHNLVRESGAGENVIAAFANNLISCHSPVIIFSEKEVCSDTALEIRNLAMMTGILGKRSAGVLCLKEKNNSQGLIDAGISTSRFPGNIEISGREVAAMAEKKWDTVKIPDHCVSVSKGLARGLFANIMIFGEDPVGCSVERGHIAGLLGKASFRVVQEYSISDTAMMADIILPASYPFETGGSFTNTQRVLQRFPPVLVSPVGMNNLEQLSALSQRLGLVAGADPDILLDEMFRFIPEKKKDIRRFIKTNGKGKNAMFRHGADMLVRLFDDYFNREMEDINGQ